MKFIIKIFCSFIICMICCGSLINIYIYTSTRQQIDTEQQFDADCILILGAGVRNGQPTPMLKDRLEEGIKLYKEKKAPKIIVSGDHSREDYDEVNIMKQYAIEQGVPSSDIFMDHAGFSTYESLYRARDIFQVKKVIIVTQDYHLYRSLYIAKALGIDAIGYSANPRTYSGQMMREAREIIARCKDFVTTIIQPKPTYLGEAIPVNGNGDITNDKAI